ncbi:cytochrome c [Tabrizicola sp. YIM 78059]|uniref:c-type cytochrome n=1 Tax=Tabrizicola sp. YIM 78059 TaxID=2529861 RepID=UPI0020C0B98C|nr:cytochrome c [Tabrizicola sp. YIM 78059]
MQSKMVLIAACLAGSALCTAGSAQEADIGATLYADHCAACHGATGMGDGDMADVVNVPSPNLTLLAKNNGGVFPMLNVLHVIDGRSGLRAHGGTMPVWGRVFSDEIGDTAGPYGSVLEVRGRVLSLAKYLESIQQ